MLGVFGHIIALLALWRDAGRDYAGSGQGRPIGLRSGLGRRRRHKEAVGLVTGCHTPGEWPGDMGPVCRVGTGRGVAESASAWRDRARRTWPRSSRT